MKFNYLLSTFAVAALIFTAACSKDEPTKDDNLIDIPVQTVVQQSVSLGGATGSLDISGGEEFIKHKF